MPPTRWGVRNRLNVYAFGHDGRSGHSRRRHERTNRSNLGALRAMTRHPAHVLAVPKTSPTTTKPVSMNERLELRLDAMNTRNIGALGTDVRG
jgi:hypothetical protein